MQEAVGEGGTESGEMNFGTRHGGGVGGADDIFGPVAVRTDENDFIFEHLPVFKNLFPSGRDEELIDGNGFVVEVWGASEAEEARATGGNSIGAARLFQHTAGEGNGGDGLELAMVISTTNDAVAIGPEIDKADATGGVVAGDFGCPHGCEGGRESHLDGGASRVTDLFKGATQDGPVSLLIHDLQEFGIALFGSGKHEIKADDLGTGLSDSLNDAGPNGAAPRPRAGGHLGEGGIGGDFFF